MPKELTPSDRVQMRGQHELMHPGACALCGSGNRDDGYVDLDIYYDYEGQMYLCRSCAEEVGNVIGMVSAEEFGHLQSMAEGLAADVTTLKAELDASTVRLTKYDDLFADRFTTVAASVGGYAGLATEQSESAPVVVSNGPIDLSGSGKPVVKKSVAGRRRDDVTQPEPSDTGFNL